MYTNSAPAPLVLRTRNNSGGSTGSVSSVESVSETIADYNSISHLLGQSMPSSPLHQMITAQLGATITPEQLAKNLTSTRYKTELCRSFTETGQCKYGDKCQFAHGAFEVKVMPRHPKYKSDLCRTFHTTGLCPYGPRCHFIHSEDESRLTEINLMKQQAAARQATHQMLQQATKLRAQQNVLQAQMQALVMSQVQLQMAQCQLNTPSPLPPTPLSGHLNKTFFPQNFNVNRQQLLAQQILHKQQQLLTSQQAADNDVFMIPSPTSSVSSEPKTVSPPPGFRVESNNRNVTNDVFENNKMNDVLAKLQSMDLESSEYSPSVSPNSSVDSPVNRLPVFNQIVV